MEREHCRREVNFALDKSCAMLAVHVEETEVPPALQLSLSHRQAILKYEYSKKAYEEKLEHALAASAVGRAEIRNEAGSSADAVTGHRERADVGSRKAPYTVGVAAVIALLAAGIWWFSQALNLIETQGASSGADSGVVVLPFENLTGDPEQLIFAEGISDEIRNGLSRSTTIKVIGPFSSDLIGEITDVRRIGERLGITHVLAGSVRNSGDGIRVTASLLDTRDRTQVWTHEDDMALADDDRVQDQIVVPVLNALNIFVEANPLIYASTDVPAAYRSLQKSSWYFRHGDFVASDAALQQAVLLDPDFADAHATVAYFTLLRVYFKDITFPEALDAMRHPLAKAKSLEPNNPLVRQIEATLTFFVDREFQQGIDEMHQLLVENPNDTGALVAYSMLLRAIDRHDLMLRVSKRLVELDPLHQGTQERYKEDLHRAGAYTIEPPAAEQSLDGYKRYELMKLAEQAKDNRDEAAFARYVEALAAKTNVDAMMKAQMGLLEGDIEPRIEWLEISITDYLWGIWNAPGCPCREGQPRSLDAEWRRYPELYADPRFRRIVENYGLDKASILEIDAPPLPF